MLVKQVIIKSNEKENLKSLHLIVDLFTQIPIGATIHMLCVY